MSTASLSIILFLLRIYFFCGFFEFFEPAIPGISFIIIEGNKVIKTSILFSLTLFLIPVLNLTARWQLGSIISITKRTYCLISILAFTIIGIWIRHQEVSVFFHRAAKKLVSSNQGNRVNYPIDPVNIVYYMLGGLCVGCWSYFDSEKIKKNQTEVLTVALFLILKS